jgi:hypothetical protein
VEGIATRVGDRYEFRPQDCSTCILEIQIKADRIVFVDADFNCGRECGYCGARAVLNAEFLFSEKQKDSQECMKSYEGELFKGNNTQ